jgi:endo-1,4-beta-xylanase
MIYRAASLLTIAAAASCVSAGLTEARQALAEREANAAISLNSLQNWSNDFADLDFNVGSNGAFSVDWDNGFGGNFVVGRGYQPGRDM